MSLSFTDQEGQKKRPSYLQKASYSLPPVGHLETRENILSQIGFYCQSKSQSYQIKDGSTKKRTYIICSMGSPMYADHP